ncbi:uncharacterized protein EDB91DRAFT_1095626 [Suillus paluster]|uniref:uncharacterized protein n=1 Tax=Suillus paluster TaxID=48578 RepID=UPI001B877B0A|nr:uncharacterized protein EDB91DRAFT_1095626 [Suillus paluster]KAG1754793.1 hypothetical protein EDB91DRAFT_1095626 [Suillus paluster]
MSRYTVALNNYYQSRQRTHLVSWVEFSSGPPHALSWTTTCKVAGETVSTATDNHKAAAKEKAAQIACEKLGINVST